MEDKNGALLETCDAGTKCREEILKTLKDKILVIWQTIMTDFKDSVEVSVAQTRAIVEDGWTEQVQCQKDHPCCSVSEIAWANNVTSIKENRKKINGLLEKWQEFEKRRVELEKMCPISVDYKCSDIGSCPDGSARNDDELCSCPDIGYAPCPATECESGIARDPATCECFGEPPQRASAPTTAYESEKITVRWDLISNSSTIKDFTVYIKDQPVKCLEDAKTKVSTQTCTFGVGVLMNDPYNMTFGDAIDASIQTVYTDFSVSTKTELGGGANIPSQDYFLAKASAWNGWYEQNDMQNEMDFEKMYISTGESVIGEGDDVVGHFTLKGTHIDGNVTFEKRYTLRDDFYVVYEGQLSSNDTVLTGKWAIWMSGALSGDTSDFQLTKQ